MYVYIYQEQNKITFNLSYYPVLQNVKKILAELDLLLTPDVAHEAVFTNVPIIGFKNGRSLKDYFVRAVLPKVDAEGRSTPCGGKNVCIPHKNAYVLVRYANQ